MPGHRDVTQEGKAQTSHRPPPSPPACMLVEQGGGRIVIFIRRRSANVPDLGLDNIYVSTLKLMRLFQLVKVFFFRNYPGSFDQAIWC